MSNENVQTVTVRRAVETDDGEGGFLEGTPTVVYTGPCRMTTDTLRFSELRDEAQPGISTQLKRFFIFDQPAPALLTQDLIQVTSAPGQPVYTVMFLWEYSKTFQVEGYLLQ